MTLVGLVGCSRLSVREYPNIVAPVVTVPTSYPGASAAIVETQVTKVLEDFLSGLEGMIAKVAHDKSIFIRELVKNVYETIGEAIALVVLIIFLFLRAFRATLVPLVTIPVSLIGAFAIKYMLRFTINTLTLLALVLAIGLVVDDASSCWRTSTVMSKTARSRSRRR